jgi:two-component system sporulation sensor kinase A
VITEHIHYDGEGVERVYEVHAHPIFNDQGDVTQIIEYTLDITDRKGMEEALRESEVRWRSLAENSPDYIVTLDMDLNIQFLNYTSPGLTAEELIGTPIYTLVGEDRQAEIKGILENVIETGQPTRYETEYDTPDGSTITYESSVVPSIVAGEVIGLTLVARDITERIQIDEALRDRTHALG